MGWRGTLRSLEAARRRAERDARRRQRELERQGKQLERMQELQRAAFEVEAYENQVEVVQSVHKECSDIWNWEAIAALEAPERPLRKRTHENLAGSRLASYRPGRLDKMLSREESKRQELLAAVEEAAQADEREYLEALEDYSQEYAEWELARGIAAGDVQAYLRAAQHAVPLDEICEPGSSVDLNGETTALIEATLCVRGEDSIPSEEKRLLKSGKLSVRSMPRTRFYKLYQDFVCGCCLRVARELSALVPVEMVLVHAKVKLVNARTGRLEEQPILSVAVPLQTLEGLDFQRLDPSECLSSFVHRMAFKKTKGFDVIQTLNPSDFESQASAPPADELTTDRAAHDARQRRIPEDVRTYVWRRDRGRCVKCGSKENLEFDHIIPVSKGGSSTARNVQLLCERCNREKSDNV